MGEAVGNAAVEIPLDVLDAGMIQHGAHGVKEIIHHILTGHVQHQLIAGKIGLPVRIRQRPVRMRAEEI